MKRSDQPPSREELGRFWIQKIGFLAQELQNAQPAIIFDDAQPSAPPLSHDDFYDKTVVLLRIALVLLAFSMDVGAGLALRKAWETSSQDLEDWGKLERRFAEVQQRMIALAFEIGVLENEGNAFKACFWANFYKSMLTYTARKAMTKVLLLVASVLTLLSIHAEAQERTVLVIAVDLTKSVDVKGPDRVTSFQKNLNGVTRVLAEAPADSQITVIGITDQSFAQPYLLLSAKIAGNAGYFGDRLRLARSQLARRWQERSASLRPSHNRTDIVGALFLAAQLFADDGRPAKKILMIFSDMRNNTAELNLESSNISPGLVAKLGRDKSLPDLRLVHVYALDVDGAGKSITYWQSLEIFWQEYFRQAGADLERYAATVAVIETP